MERRDFLKALGMAGGVAALGCQHGAQRCGRRSAAQPTPAAPPPAMGTESRKAWSELLALLADADERYLGKDWEIERAGDIADGHRFLMHVLHSGMEQWLEADPLRPRAVRFVTPTLKLLGDNPDAIYFTAPLDPKRRYRVRGNTGGAVYTSLTIEGGNAEGHYPKRVAGALNDTQFDVKRDGSFEVLLGPGEKGRNRLALEPDAGTLTTRHYFETVTSVGGRSEPEGAPLRRSGRRSGAAAHAERREHRRGDPARGELLPRRHARSAAAGSGEAAALGVARAERVQGADEVAARRGRVRRGGQRLLDGALCRDCPIRRS